ncbi:hypothetical protein [Streptomyces sp. AC495_CC817]|uniref:hypothetical protein n=1 Tax=Streptomyces sp. AC495_CC817 TaxID=2823900 RepID=UPI001C25C910|nr:hypothetical protein [Streptomyces sp. AC495_CC817]
MDDSSVAYGDSNSGGMEEWSPTAQFKVKTIIANAWAAMDEEYRRQLCDHGMATGNIGTKWHREDQAIVFTWAGTDIAVAEEAWLMDDGNMTFPEAVFLPECPDDLSGLG